MTRHLTTKEFISRARIVHGDKYDYSTTNFVGWHTKITYYCKEHDLLISQMPYAHLRGNGCKLCGHKTQGKSDVTYSDKIKRAKRKKEKHYGDKDSMPYGSIKRKDAKELCLNKIKSIFGDKYRSYAFVDGKTISAICSEHGLFTNKIASFLNGIGCPMCSEIKFKGEKSILDILNKKNIKYEYQFVIDVSYMQGTQNTIICDFFLPNYNIIIEYNGKQHYHPIEFFGGKDRFKIQVERDDLLKTYCKEKGIKLVEIPYTEYDNIERILGEILNIN